MGTAPRREKTRSSSSRMCCSEDSIPWWSQNHESDPVRNSGRRRFAGRMGLEERLRQKLSLLDGHLHHHHRHYLHHHLHHHHGHLNHHHPHPQHPHSEHHDQGEPAHSLLLWLLLGTRDTFCFSGQVSNCSR